MYWSVITWMYLKSSMWIQRVYNSLYEILGHTKLINVVRNRTAVVPASGGDWLAHKDWLRKGTMKFLYWWKCSIFWCRNIYKGICIYQNLRFSQSTLFKLHFKSKVHAFKMLVEHTQRHTLNLEWFAVNIQ